MARLRAKGVWFEFGWLSVDKTVSSRVLSQVFLRWKAACIEGSVTRRSSLARSRAKLESCGRTRKEHTERCKRRMEGCGYGEIGRS